MRCSMNSAMNTDELTTRSPFPSTLVLSRVEGAQAGGGRTADSVIAHVGASLLATISPGAKWRASPEGVRLIYEANNFAAKAAPTVARVTWVPAFLTSRSDTVERTTA